MSVQRVLQPQVWMGPYTSRAGGGVQLVEHLPNKCETLCSNSITNNTNKNSMLRLPLGRSLQNLSPQDKSSTLLDFGNNHLATSPVLGTDLFFFF
jgi:hypothetical protein